MRSTFAIAGALALASSVASAQPSVVRVAPFNAVAVEDGAKVRVRYGPTQRVTFVRGGPEVTRLTVGRSGRLLIEKCAGHCPRGYVSEIEIVTPSLTSISVNDGGTIQTVGTFPRQREIGVAVSHGGTADIRSIPAERVSASVHQGGRILTVPQSALTANISNGGTVIYWAGPQVQLTSSVRHGGMVTEGEASDVDKPLSEMSHSAPKVSPVRPVRGVRGVLSL